MQTVSFAGSSYNIPTVRGDRPWSGLSDFVIAAASKAINTAGGNFTLLANINFGATFGLVSAYYTSRTANAASAGQLRLANTDTIKFRNTLNDGDLSVAISSNRLTFEGSRLLIASAAEIVNADISASAAIAVTKLAALTASRAVVSNGSGFLASATTTATEIGYVNGVTSAIQTQIDLKTSAASPTFTGTVTLPVTADRALQTGTSSVLEASATTKTELGYVSGVTSAIQTQLTAKATDTLVVHLAGTESVTGSKTLSSTSGNPIHGISTNTPAAAGYVGEVIRSTAVTTFTSTTAKNLASINLTAGNWIIYSSVYFHTSATLSSAAANITTTSGTLDGTQGEGRMDIGTTTGGDAGVTMFLPASLSGAVTYYVVCVLTGTGTLTSGGQIFAVRTN